MQADYSEMGKGFYKLVLARNSELRDDIVNYDGEHTSLLDCYVLDTEDAGEGDYKFKEYLGKVEIVRVVAVAVIGEHSGGVSCYAKETVAYKDEQDRIWLDEQLHDEVFC